MNDPLLVASLLKLAPPLLGVAVILSVTRMKGLSWNQALGFAPPTAARLVGWLALWIAWVSVVEALSRVFSIGTPPPWPEYPAHILALRIAAIGLAGPFAEELLMRGLLLHVLASTRLRSWGAIVVVAFGWAALHLQYAPADLAIVAADGVVLGAARLFGGSLWLPIIMHATGNLFSIYQSLAA